MIEDFLRSNRVLALAAAAAFLLFLLPGALGPYGLFIDELYYLACAERPDFGYVDHPPLAPLLLRLSRWLAGGAAWAALRVPAALVGALTVALTGFVARRLGAGLWGQAIAMACVAIAPVLQLFFGFYSVNAFEMLLWLAAGAILVEIELRREPRLWLLFGAVAGLGLENKHTFVLLGGALAVALVVTPSRRHLLSPWLWAGAGIAALLLLPNLVWQAAHGWPSLEFYKNADLYKNVPTPPPAVLAQQVLFMNPGTLPVWVAGLAFFLASRREPRLRHLGWIFLVLLALMLVAQKSRPDRISGIYPVLFAAGGAAFDRLAAGRGWLRWALPAWMVVWGIALAPVGLPILPPERMAAYTARLGVVPQIERGEGKTAELPQWFADRFGWRQLAEEVETAVDRHLSPEERRRAVVFAPSYGQAGALELYGRDLPPVYSTHNSYYLWGPPPEPFEAAVLVGDRRERLEELFEEVELALVHDCDYCMRWRDEMPIWIARRPRPGLDMAEIWAAGKHFE